MSDSLNIKHYDILLTQIWTLWWDKIEAEHGAAAKRLAKTHRKYGKEYCKEMQKEVESVYDRCFIEAQYGANRVRNTTRCDMVIAAYRDAVDSYENDQICIQEAELAGELEILKN